MIEKVWSEKEEPILGAHNVIETLFKHLIFVMVLIAPPFLHLDLFNLTFSSKTI